MGELRGDVSILSFADLLHSGAARNGVHMAPLLEGSPGFGLRDLSNLAVPNVANGASLAGMHQHFGRV